MLVRVEHMRLEDMLTYTDWRSTVRLLTMQLNDWRTIYERACAADALTPTLTFYNTQIHLSGRVFVSKAMSCDRILSKAFKMFRSPTLDTLTAFAYVLYHFKWALNGNFASYNRVDVYMMTVSNAKKRGQASKNGALSPSSLDLVNYMTYKICETRVDGEDDASKAVRQVSPLIQSNPIRTNSNLN